MVNTRKNPPFSIEELKILKAQLDDGVLWEEIAKTMRRDLSNLKNVAYARRWTNSAFKRRAARRIVGKVEVKELLLLARLKSGNAMPLAAGHEETWGPIANGLAWPPLLIPTK